jgi:hypothetical protein
MFFVVWLVLLESNEFPTSHTYGEEASRVQSMWYKLYGTFPFFVGTILHFLCHHVANSFFLIYLENCGAVVVIAWMMSAKC